VRESATGIDNIFTEVATLPSSIAPQLVATWSYFSLGTIVSDESFSLAGFGRAEQSLGQPIQSRTTSEEYDPSGLMLGSSICITAVYVKFFLFRSQRLMYTGFLSRRTKQQSPSILAKAKLCSRSPKTTVAHASCSDSVAHQTKNQDGSVRGFTEQFV
jgi:hypothetical protein